MVYICEILVGGVKYVKSNLPRSKISFRRCNMMEYICEILVGGVNYVKSNLPKSKISFRRCNMMECICKILAGGGGGGLYIHRSTYTRKTD